MKISLLLSSHSCLHKSMGGVDFADMLIALYLIKIKTKWWYIKIFWHMVGICKINAWNLYCQRFIQYGDPVNKKESFLSFSSDIANALINAFKPKVKVGSHQNAWESQLLVPVKKLQLQLPAMIFATIKWAISQRQLKRSSGANFAKLIHVPSVDSVKFHYAFWKKDIVVRTFI